MGAGALAVVMALPAAALAGPYGAGFDDPTNPYDPPVAADDARIAAWADHLVRYDPAPGVGAGYQDPSGLMSLGDLYDPADPPATGETPSFHAVKQPFGGDVADTSDSYGFIGYDDPGSVTVRFDTAVRNGEGTDLAVFENGFGIVGGDVQAELAYVEVSSDGEHFARFASTDDNTLDDLDTTFGRGYAGVDPTNIHNLAGKTVSGWGAALDLSDLADDPLVADGLVDLNDIKQVRLVDIPGNGDFTDARGQPIYDSWVTEDSGGYDFRLDQGVAGLHLVPEPGSILLLGAAGLLLAGRRRRRA